MFTTWKRIEDKLSWEAVQNFKLECFKDCSCEGLGLRDRKALGVYDNNNDNSYDDNDNYKNNKITDNDEYIYGNNIIVIITLLCYS